MNDYESPTIAISGAPLAGRIDDGRTVERRGAATETRMRGPRAKATKRSRIFAGTLRRGVRPFLDRMPVDQKSVNRLRWLTSGVGLAPALESLAAWDDTGPVSGLWVRRQRFAAASHVILYLHGGGFTFGSPLSHRALAARIADQSTTPVFLPRYRLAPEQPYPAAPHDALAAYHWLIEQGYTADRVIIGGDSAGGNLAVGLLAELTRRGEDLPASVILLSPWLDLSLDDAHRRDAANKDPFLAIHLADSSRDVYTGDADVHDPQISPLFCDVSESWPPFFIQAGGLESMIDGVSLFAEKLQDAGVSCALQVWPHQIHVFQAFHPFVPEANQATRDIGEFVRNVVRNPGTG